LSAIGDPPVTLSLWNGEAVSTAKSPDENIQIHIRSRRTLWRILSNPFYQFPEAYCTHDVDIDGDLEQLMCLVGRSAARDPSKSRWFNFVSQVLHLPHRNSLSGSRDNIHRHYDLGNDFYRLWLDENLLYTCAYFEDPTTSLEQAQCAKMDHVCRKLALRPGESVIEAGCGWGGFALHMARNYGVRVRAFNISQEQVKEARQRARAAGLEDRVEFILDDWRNITGKCDVFASIGMLEHVGTVNYRELGDVIDRCLSPEGRGLIHSIGRNRRQPLDTWTERRIFPGAYPPSLGEMSPIFEPHELSVLDVENLRLHYAETLRHWLTRYEQSVEQVQRMYDARFVRSWRMYLASSVAAFDSGSLQLFQILFARPLQNRIPITRAHHYRHLFNGVECPTEQGGEPATPAFWGSP